MPKFKIFIDQEALQDMQEAIDWYNKQQTGLGTRFHKQLIAQINSLKRNPLIYKIRYNNVRCMLTKRFPFLIHFTVDETYNTVSVFALFHTSRNPKIWLKRNK